MKDWSVRPYVPDLNYPEQERAKTAKGQYNKVLEIAPEFAEFLNNVPGQELISGFAEFMAQSNFKKPYLDAGYPEMEYLADAPPGIDPQDPGGPQFDFPPFLPQPVGPCPEINPVFKVTINDIICRGQWTSIRIHPSQPEILKVMLIDTLWGIEWRKTPRVKGYRSIDVYVPESFPGTYVRFDFQLKSRCDLIRWTNQTIDIHSGYGPYDKCPRLFAVLNVKINTLSAPPYDRYIVWDFDLGGIATNIPNGVGGFVTFPCVLSALTPWMTLFHASSSVPSYLDCTKPPAFDITSMNNHPLFIITIPPGGGSDTQITNFYNGTQFAECFVIGTRTITGADCNISGAGIQEIRDTIDYDWCIGFSALPYYGFLISGKFRYGATGPESGEDNWIVRYLESYHTDFSTFYEYQGSVPCSLISQTFHRDEIYFKYVVNSDIVFTTGSRTIFLPYTMSFNALRGMVSTGWNVGETLAVAEKRPDAIITIHIGSTYTTVGAPLEGYGCLAHLVYNKHGFINSGLLNISPWTISPTLGSSIKGIMDSAHAAGGTITGSSWGIQFKYGVY